MRRENHQLQTWERRIPPFNTRILQPNQDGHKPGGVNELSEKEETLVHNSEAVIDGAVLRTAGLQLSYGVHSRNDGKQCWMCDGLSSYYITQDVGEESTPQLLNSHGASIQSFSPAINV